MDDLDLRAKLIHRYLDDSLNLTEESELIASLEHSADARRQFVEEAFLNHDLREAMREADIRSFIVSGEDEASLGHGCASETFGMQRRSAAPSGGARE